jgi:hypothetical protein
VRLYFPDEEQDAPVVICSELPADEGASVTYAAEQLAAEVIRYHRLSAPVVWIEHHPPETTDGSTETFALVAFSSYEVRERTPYMGEVRLSVVVERSDGVIKTMKERVVTGSGLRLRLEEGGRGRLDFPHP